jgi:hypothetical protein
MLLIYAIKCISGLGDITHNLDDFSHNTRQLESCTSAIAIPLSGKL